MQSPSTSRNSDVQMQSGVEVHGDDAQSLDSRRLSNTVEVLASSAASSASDGQEASEGCFTRCFTRCSRLFLASHHVMPQNPSRYERLVHSLRCPPQQWLGAALFHVFCFCCLWGFAWGAGKSLALPGGLAFSLMILYILCSAAGQLVALVRIAPVIGMLIMGSILGNVPAIEQIIVIDPKWASTIRIMVRVVVMIRAGLALDQDISKQLKTMILRLGPLSTVVEAVAYAVATRFLLDFTWKFSFIQGFTLSAVGLPVVFPSMLRCEEQRLGTEKGIPTLVMISASSGNVIAIVTPALLLGTIFFQGNLTWKILRAPVEVLIGLVYGIGIGTFIWYLPSTDSDGLQGKRFLFVLSAGLCTVFVGKSIELPGAGGLGCIILAFISALGWRSAASGRVRNRVPALFTRLWWVFETLIYGLIGYEIDVQEIDKKAVGLGLCVLLIGFSARFVAVLVSTLGSGFCFKERVFMAMIWWPKATVQAAVGSLAYDMAKDLGSDEERAVGLKILVLSVISIIITSPLGDAVLPFSAKRFLRRAVPEGLSEPTHL